ncbi:class V lanthionine synthetase subunit LxmK [Streptomyces sioyaensis]|uniref:class V lanthionine synthetase subunit LxmK n=1 Tax=Streptomyces sioyaensis TaxID=67364 RepID=UPI0037BE1310
MKLRHDTLPVPSDHDNAVRFQAIDLNRAPEVEALLHRLDLGRFDRETVTGPMGRNDTWAGHTDAGHAVFVKRLVGARDDVRARLRRAMSYERLAAASGGVLRSPRLLGADPENALLAFDYLAGARIGRDLVVAERFGPELSRSAGRALGLLHSAPVESGHDLDRSVPHLPSLRPFEGLPPAMFDASSSAALEAWRLLQNDPRLRDAVASLLHAEELAPRTPAHCDLRVDQFLIDEGSRDRLSVTDWEEFRLADPARDVGAFAGEWLHRSILDIVTSRGDAEFMDVTLTRERVLSRGVEKLTRLRPNIEAFCAGYRQARPETDQGLAERAAGFAGWHMLDRLIAGASQRPRLLPVERAAAGVGRTALLDPAQFITVLGLGGLT